MTFLIEIAALLAFAAVVTVLVLLGLRLGIPKEPHARSTDRPRLRERLASSVFFWHSSLWSCCRPRS
jgi:hypothetical protein